MALLAGADRRNWRAEVLRGITLAAVSAPLALACAQLAGLPPLAGLYALIAPGALYALIAGSGRSTAAPDVTGALLVAAALGPLAATGASAPAASPTASYAELALGQALLTAAAFLVLGLLRLDVIALLLPHPVLIGFTAALALDALVRELGIMFGIRVTIRGPADAAAGGFPEHVAALARGLDHAVLWAVVLAAGCVVILLLGRRIARGFPWELVAFAVAMAGTAVFGLAGRGVTQLGRVPTGLPPLGWPSLTGAQWLALVPGAVVLAATALALHRDDAPLRAGADGRDNLGYAIANAAAGLSGGLALLPSATRRARLDDARATSQLPTLVAAVLVLATVVFGGELIARVPLPALGAVVAVAIAPQLRLRELRRLGRAGAVELLLALATAAAVLVLGVLPGLGVGAGLALVRLLRGARTPALDVLDADGRPIASLRDGQPAPRTTAPGVTVVRLAARLDDAGAEALARGIRAVMSGPVPPRHLVLDGEAIAAIDATGAEVLRAVVSGLREHGVSVDYCRARAVLRLDLEHHGLLGPAHVFRTIREALDVLAEPGR